MASLGIATAVWFVLSIHAFFAGQMAKDLAPGLLVGDRFKISLLRPILRQIQAKPSQAFERIDFLRLEALVQLRISAEAGWQRSSAEAGGADYTAIEALRRALASNPTDSMLWLMLYQSELDRVGFDEKNASFLARSYAAGPLEGWIALSRNRLSLAIFQLLDPAAQECIVKEFTALISADFIDQAAFNLETTGWPHRARLLEALGEVDVSLREKFAKKLASDGVDSLVPGVQLDLRLLR